MSNEKINLFFVSLQGLPNIKVAFKLNYIHLLMIRRIKQSPITRNALIQESFLSELSIAQRYRYIAQLRQEGFIMKKNNLLTLKY